MKQLIKIRRATFSILALSTAIGIVRLPAVRAADMPVWQDPSKTPDERARDLLAQLTPQEKVALVHADGTFTSPGVPRLHIPKLWMSDGPQGVREEVSATGWNAASRTDDFSTAMPADIGLAASFDPDLAKAFGDVIGEEALTRGKDIMLSPGLNIMRTPLNGRNSEYFGEDPYLSSRMAVAFIQAVQSHGVSSCAKHYALNNQETARGAVNVHVDERTMREIYLPAFKAAVKEAGVWCVMSAYNRVNGQYCSENEFLLNQVLKKEWGFPGLVMTDWSGCHSTIEAANNGLDLEMGSNVGGTHDKDYLASLGDAISAGKVPAGKLDEMALRNLRVMAFVGLLNVGDKKEIPNSLMSPAHIETARKVEEAACVLLKNDKNVLPIDSTKVKTIAVIGANATAKFAHDGNSAMIKTAYEITPLEGITRRAGDGIKVVYSPGYQGYVRRAGRRGLGGAVVAATTSATSATAANASGSNAPATSPADLMASAVETASSADVVIVVAGLYRALDQEGQDRPNMELPPGQSELIQAVVKANPNTVVVLNGGSPSNVNPWIDDTAGLLMYWYGGTEGGNALARVLFGDVNPSGHLPCTYPRSLSDSPAHASGDQLQFPGTGTNAGRGQRNTPLTPEMGPQENYSEGILVGYRWFDARKIEPQFPFGFGLSYTQFNITDLQLTPGEQDGTVFVKATVHNTGARDGAEVVQVYVQQNNPDPQFPRPPHELKAFKKITVASGASGDVTMNLDPSSFAYFNTDKHAWVAASGDYTILAGDSSRNLTAQATFHLPTTVTIEETK